MRRWPMALFHNMVDVAAYNAFVVSREVRPGWMAGKLNRRRLFPLPRMLGQSARAPCDPGQGARSGLLFVLGRCGGRRGVT